MIKNGWKTYKCYHFFYNNNSSNWKEFNIWGCKMILYQTYSIEIHESAFPVEKETDLLNLIHNYQQLWSVLKCWC